MKKILNQSIFLVLFVAACMTVFCENTIASDTKVYSVSELRSQDFSKVESVIRVVEGYVINIDSSHKGCKPEMYGNNVLISEKPRKYSGNYWTNMQMNDLIVETNRPEQFKLYKKYKFKVLVSAYKMGVEVDSGDHNVKLVSVTLINDIKNKKYLDSLMSN